LAAFHPETTAKQFAKFIAYFVVSAPEGIIGGM